MLSIPFLSLITVPIATVSCAICSSKIYSLARRAQLRNKRQSSAKGPAKQQPDYRHHAATTGILFTIIYLIFNIPYSVIYFYVQIVSTSKGIPAKFVIPSVNFKCYVAGFTHVVFISLNATINPLLYFYRIKEFRDYIVENISRRQAERGNNNSKIAVIFINRTISSKYT